MVSSFTASSSSLGRRLTLCAAFIQHNVTLPETSSSSPRKTSLIMVNRAPRASLT